jgi:hypothetical protein
MVAGQIGLHGILALLLVVVVIKHTRELATILFQQLVAKIALVIVLKYNLAMSSLVLLVCSFFI